MTFIEIEFITEIQGLKLKQESPWRAGTFPWFCYIIPNIIHTYFAIQQTEGIKLKLTPSTNFILINFWYHDILKSFLV